MRQAWIGLITTLLIVVLIEVSLITKTLAPNIFPLQNKSIQQNPQTNSTSNIPELPAEFTWKAESLSDHDSIFYTNRNFLLNEKTGNISISNLSGKEWVSKKNVNSKKEIDNYEFKNSYSKTLLVSGWTNNLIFHNMSLQGIAADGPTGGIIGFLKTNGNELQIIILSQQVTNFNNTEFAYGCPCTLTSRVFLSNPISAENLKLEE